MDVLLFATTGTSINHLHASNLHDGSTAMHRAVECIDEKKGQKNVLLLLRKDPSTINLQNFKGFSPLHLAAKKDRKQIVKTIVVRHFYLFLFSYTIDFIRFVWDLTLKLNLHYSIVHY